MTTLPGCLSPPTACSRQSPYKLKARRVSALILPPPLPSPLPPAHQFTPTLAPSSHLNAPPCRTTPPRPNPHPHCSPPEVPAPGSHHLPAECRPYQQALQLQMDRNIIKSLRKAQLLLAIPSHLANKLKLRLSQLCRWSGWALATDYDAGACTGAYCCWSCMLF